jgi:hypothetical protein
MWVKARAPDAPLTFKCSGPGGDDVGPGMGPKGGAAENAMGAVGGMIGSAMEKLPDLGSMGGLRNKTVMIEPHFNLKITLHRCKNLAKADMFGKSDPCVVVKYKGKEVARSPIVNKNLNPEWGTTTERGFTGGHLFSPFVEVFSDKDGKLTEDEKDELVMLEVYDCDMKMLGDFLGCVSFRVGRILGMKGTSDAEFQLQQKEGAKKKSKLVKGTVHISVDNEFDPGGEKEVEGLLNKGLGFAKRSMRDQTLDADATDYGVVDFSKTGNNLK